MKTILSKEIEKSGYTYTLQGIDKSGYIYEELENLSCSESLEYTVAMLSIDKIRTIKEINEHTGETTYEHTKETI